MKQSLSRLISDYGMVFILVLLCAFFSVVTYSEQSPTGDSAARQLAAAIQKQFGKAPRILIATRDQPDEAAFAKKLEGELAAVGGQVLAVVKGEPKDAREALQKIVGSG